MSGSCVYGWLSGWRRGVTDLWPDFRPHPHGVNTTKVMQCDPRNVTVTVMRTLTAHQFVEFHVGIHLLHIKVISVKLHAHTKQTYLTLQTQTLHLPFLSQVVPVSVKHYIAKQKIAYLCIFLRERERLQCFC